MDNSYNNVEPATGIPQRPDNLYLIEVSGWRGFRFMKIRAANEELARIVAARKIWPKRGEYIKNVTKERA